MMEGEDEEPIVYPPVGRCIYCPSTEQLSKEHVIPYALNGNHILPKASCESCRKATQKFEQEVLRGSLQQVRVALGMKSRTNHSEAPKTKPVTITNKAGSTAQVNIGFTDGPVMFGFPLFVPPAYLTNAQYDSGISMTGIATYSFGKTPEESAAELGAERLSWESDNRYVSFARMIAKIAYATIVAENGLGVFDGEAYVLPSIRGDVDEIGKWVGTLTKPYETHLTPPSLPHRIVPGKGSDPRLLIAEVQLFASAGTPSYGVILGRTMKDL